MTEKENPLAKPMTSALEAEIVGVGPRVAAAMAAALESSGIVLARRSEELEVCPACSLYFAPSRTDQVYCRPACRQAAFQARVAIDVKITATGSVRQADVVAPSVEDLAAFELREGKGIARRRRSQ